MSSSMLLTLLLVLGVVSGLFWARRVKERKFRGKHLILLISSIFFAAGCFLMSGLFLGYFLKVTQAKGAPPLAFFLIFGPALVGFISLIFSVAIGTYIIICKYSTKSETKRGETQKI